MREWQKCDEIKEKYKISVEDIAEFIFVDASFIRSVECYDKKYNLRHLYLIMALFKKDR